MIKIQAGGGSMITMKMLRSGAQFINFGGKNLIDLHVKNGKLLITMEVRKMDLSFIGQIKDNELKPIPKDYTFYASEKFIELYDNFHLPVLQVDLDKTTNTIYVNLLYFHRTGFIIFADTHMEMVSYGKPYAYMSQEERDIWLDKIHLVANKYFKPKHE